MVSSVFYCGKELVDAFEAGRQPPDGCQPRRNLHFDPPLILFGWEFTRSYVRNEFLRNPVTLCAAEADLMNVPMILENLDLSLKILVRLEVIHEHVGKSAAKYPLIARDHELSKK